MKAHSFSLKYLSVILLALLLVFGFGWSTAEANTDKVEVLIGFEGKPGPAEHRLIKSQGGEVTKELERIDVLLVELPSHASDRAVNALQNIPNISFVEENGTMEAHSQTVPWGIDRVFGDESYSFPTWNTSEGERIGVAILDTGIDLRHEDLEVAGGFATVNCFPPARCARPWDDDHGHGTHVAGTVAALNNEKGVVGVAPNIDLYAVKVLDRNGGGSWADIANGITWATDEDIEIINMSLGGGHSSTVQRAVKYAHEAGVLLVASAGNSGPGENTVSYPAAYPEVIAVSATDINDEFPNFSSRGSQVELAAPGVSILSTVPGGYETKSGTSMASPHVAGVAALVWATDSDMDNVKVREILQDTAEDIGLSSDRQGYGLARADLAVGSLDDGDDDGEETVVISIDTLDASDVSTSSAKLSGEITEIKNTDKVSVYFKWRKDSGENWNETSSKIITEPKEFSETIDGLEDDTSYEFKAVAKVDETIKEGDTLSFSTSPEDPGDENGEISEPEIETVTYSTRSTGPWQRVDVSWSVFHEEGKLEEVKTEILDEDGNILDSQTTEISGETAEGTSNLRTRQTPVKIRVTVSAEGQETEKITEIE